MTLAINEAILDDAAGKRVALCIPHRDHVTAEWAFRFSDLARRPEWQLLRTSAPAIDIARDALVLSALNRCATRIVFLDSDVLPMDNDALLRLADHPAPIISGVYWARKGGFTQTAAVWQKVPWEGQNMFHPFQETSPAPIEMADVVGTGFCAIDSKVFMAMKPPWFFWTKDRMRGWATIVGGSSEDFGFFNRAKVELKTRVAVDMTLQARHATVAEIQPGGQMTVLGAGVEQ